MDTEKYIIILLIILLIIAIFDRVIQKLSEILKIERIPEYKKINLLTKREYAFFKELKKVTEPRNVQILAKVRLADLIEPKLSTKSKQGYGDFSRIKSKHIDFVIVDDMKVLLLIELDDSSHGRTDRKDRDNFINKIIPKAGYTLIRTYGDTKEIEEKLEEIGYSD